MSVTMYRFLDMRKIRKVADYQFGSEIGEKFFPDEVEIEYSKLTGRIRRVFLKEDLLATLRPRDGFFALTVAGARRLVSILEPPRLRVIVENGFEEIIAEGKNVFAKHVVGSDPEIRPREEVIVTDKKDNVLAVGRAVLTGKEMLKFERGVAVETRDGVAKKATNQASSSRS